LSIHRGLGEERTIRYDTILSVRVRWAR